MVPLPTGAMPSASLRQFMLLAVNMPEQQPHVGQPRSSYLLRVHLFTPLSPPATITSIRSQSLPLTLPASIGPPETNTAGILSLMAAISMPGVILSQLEMQIMASAQCALHMYSTLSAMISREGRL